MLGDFNAVVNAQIDCIGSTNRKGNPGFKWLLGSYNLADGYSLDDPSSPVWTSLNMNVSYKSYIDRIMIRERDRDTVSCSQIYIVPCRDHKILTCRVILDECHRQGHRYWELNKTILTYKSFFNRVRELVQRAFTGTIINNRWCCALKRAISFESVRFSNRLSLDKLRIDDV